MAAYSSLTSPICTWPVANYISSVAYQKNHNTLNSSMFQYPKGHKKLMSRSRCSNINGYSRLLYYIHLGNTIAVSLQPEEELKTEKQQRKVAVTGMGVVTPLDHHPDVFYSNLLEGVSGISEIQSFDCSKFPTRIAGEIKSLSTDGWVSPKHAKRADKFMLYILTAGKKALADGGVTEQVNEEFDKIKCGVLIGSALGLTK
ncbi:hypothetical protein Patl1_33764 [Pistacia atlantica]|uniref:Uncharacterized protein n=1 Tax=Pistacia atlantica TaxID=434234 RepID=A0ACC0ZWM0_9ROSI|nr:hypothetical protein Patl1_33764 [Pistacia atlantica]